MFLSDRTASAARCVALLLALLLPGCGGGGGDQRIDRQSLTLLAAYSNAQRGIGTVGIFRELELTLALHPDGPQLFEGYVLRSGSDAPEVEAHAGSDRDFERFVDLLTNGSNDTLHVRSALVGSGAASAVGVEEALIVASVQGPAAQDLQGFEIVLITYQAEHVELKSPGVDPNGDGNFTEISYVVTLRIFGRRR